jgi:predicted  nucleic acid-binding Zn-ribbon protein
MPMQSGVPDLVRHAVVAIAKQYGGDTDKAFAIAVAQMQKSGYLEKGSMKLTAAGKKKEKEHESDPDFKSKMAEYEKLLKANRKEESIRGYKFPFYAHNEGEEEFGAMQAKIVKAAKEGGYEKAMYSHIDAKSQKEMQRAMNSAKAESFSYKNDAEWDPAFYERLVNPTAKTGLENAPRTVARRWDAVREEESDMTFMRRLAGVGQRYTDRTLDEAVLSEGFKAGDKVDIWDGEDLISMGTYVSASQPIAGMDTAKVKIEKNFTRRAPNKVGSVGEYGADMLLPAKQGLKKKGVEESVALEAKSKSKAKVGGKVFTLFIDGQEKFGFHASDEKDADNKAKGWLLYQFGSYNRVKWEVKQQEPEYANNIHDEWLREAEESENDALTEEYKCLECGKKFKTAKAAEKAMDDGCPKCGGSDIDLAEANLSVTDRLRALLSEADEPEEYYFHSEDGGMFVLQKMGNKFMVATAGVTADDAMADLYTRAVRKAASMSDAIKIIKKMVR